jgi:hypothetical protein
MTIKTIRDFLSINLKSNKNKAKQNKIPMRLCEVWTYCFPYFLNFFLLSFSFLFNFPYVHCKDICSLFIAEHFFSLVNSIWLHFGKISSSLLWLVLPLTKKFGVLDLPSPWHWCKQESWQWPTLDQLDVLSENGEW